MRATTSICLFICLFALSIEAYSQTTNFQKFEESISVLPAAPNAASLNKYGGINVSLNKGMINHSIPLYSLKLKDVTIPIVLNYSSNGFKVSEYASRVGWGWTLEGGGVISRTVAGWPDESSTRLNLPEGGIGQTTTSYNFLLNATGGATYDTQPDVFNFNFNGYSGRFVLDSNNNPVLIPASNLKIEKDFNSSVYTFKITTPDGNQFFFGGDSATEKTRHETTCSKPYESYIPTAWYLKQIQTLHGQVVNFYYESINFTFYTGITQSIYYDGFDGGTVCYNQDNVQYICPQYANLSGVCQNLLRSSGVYLKKISSTGIATVNFTDSTRSDCGDILYTGFTVTDVNGLLKDKHQLSYNQYSLRPFLTAVSKTDLISQSKETTTLVYNDPLAMEAVNSFSQDHWGYYNGKGNSSLVQKPELFSHQARYPGATADRSPDAIYAAKGMLSKIIYPTGGTDTIFYESNDFHEYKQILPAYAEIIKTVTGTGLMSAVTSETSYFDLSFGQEGKLDIEIENLSSNGAFDSLHNKGTVEIFDVNGYSYFSQSYVPGTTTSEVVFLNAGTYKIVVTGRGDCCKVNAKLTCRPGSASWQHVNTAIGGVRVKKVISSDFIAPPQIKSYYYNKINSFDTSSGGAPFDINYMNDFYTRRVCCNNGMCAYDYCSHQGLYSNSMNSLARYPGGVSYAAVTESFGENMENGAIEHVYLIAEDQPAAVINGDPIVGRPSTNSTMDGKELETNVYRRNGQNLELVKKTTYTYKIDNTGGNTVQGVVVNRRYEHLIGHNPPGELEIEEFNVAGYFHISSWVYVDTLTEYSYDVAGHSSVSQTTYAYDNAQHKMLSKTATKLSNGNLIEAYTKYPQDYPSVVANDPISESVMSLQNKYAITVPVEKRTIIKSSNSTNERLAGASLSIFDGSANLKEIRQIESQNPLTDFAVSSVDNGAVNIDSRYKTQVSFENYDAKGNLLQQSEQNDIKKSYIWDYNKTLPVAEVINAASDQIAYTSFEADGTGNWNKNGTFVEGGVTGVIAFNGILSLSVPTGDYVITLWKYTGTSATVNGSSGALISTKNDWQLYEWNLSSISSVSVSGTNIDEVRLYPKGAMMSTVTYSPLLGVTTMCDVNNRINYYSYDGLGRLSYIRVQDYNILKKYAYNYATQGEYTCINGECVFYNIQKSGNFTKSCGTGYTGSVVTYIVPANTYSSSVSQQAADQLAQNDVDNNGQDYANTNGTCSPVMVTLTSKNLVQVSGFTAVYTNVSTNQQYSFTISSSSGQVTMGSVPPGTYNISISKSGNTTKYTFTVFDNPCSAISLLRASATFFDVVVSETASCNGLEINGAVN